MSDVKEYIQKRAERDAEFAENYETGHADFKVMKTVATFEKIHHELEAGIHLPKCQQCGCMRGALEVFGQPMPGLGGEAARLAETVAGWRALLKDVRYACLGCEVCYAALAENTFSQAFPTVILPPALVCQIQSSPGDWPAVLGEYFVLDGRAAAAVSTLADAPLAEELARLKPAGLAITGKTETENIGVEKVVKNLIANPALRFLIVAGNESQGHQSGDALLALSQNGVDEGGRVIGAAGKHPVLPNLTPAEIRAFRAQIQVIDLRGCTDAQQIAARVSELAAPRAGVGPARFDEGLLIPLTLEAPAAKVAARPKAAAALSAENCADPQCACHTPAPITPPRIVAGDGARDIPLDKAGYFVILPAAEKKRIQVEHYGYDHALLHVIEGASSRALYLRIIGEGWVTELSHAAYLGKELAKAELALRYGFQYVQDGA